jgi:hypothetical protein
MVMCEVLSVETAAGQYDVMPARPEDGAPSGATHAVFHEDGGLAGFASASMAWQSDARGGDVIGSATSLGQAARMVAEVDGELFGVAAECGIDECDCGDFRGVDDVRAVLALAGNVDPNQPGHGDVARCTETAPCGDSGCGRCAVWE